MNEIAKTLATKHCNGCNTDLPLDAFTDRPRVGAGGKKVINKVAKCKVCTRETDKARAKEYRRRRKITQVPMGYEPLKGRNCAKRREIKHTGPTGVEQLFFCTLPPARRGT